MEIVKLLKDYSKTPLESNLNDLLSQKLDTTICCEKITNKKFLLKYVQPINDFIVHTTALPCCDVRRMLY